MTSGGTYRQQKEKIRSQPRRISLTASSCWKESLETSLTLGARPSATFMLRTTWQRKCFFPVGVEMVYMFCLSRLQRHCLRFSHLHVSLLPLMSGIVDVGIPVHVFCIFYARMMILPASTCKSQRPCLIKLVRLADRSP